MKPKPKVLCFGRRINLAASAAGEGKPRRFMVEAYDGGPLPVDGFDLPVIVDLATTEFPESMPLLIDHQADVESTLGSTDLVENNGQTLNISGVVTATSAKALQVVEQFDRGQKWQASIGVRIGDLQDVAAGQVVVVNKQQFRGPVLVARNNQCYETSVLPAGADWTTRVNLAARAAKLKGSAMPTFEEWLSSKGVDPATINDEQLAALMAEYEAEKAASGGGETVAARVARIRASKRKLGAKRRVRAGDGLEEEDKEELSASAAPTFEEWAAAQGVDLATLDEAALAALVMAYDAEMAGTSVPVSAPAVTARVRQQASQDLLASMRKTQADEYRRVGEVEKLTVGYPAIRATAIEKGWSPMQTENAVLKAKAKQSAPDNSRRGGGSGMSGATPDILTAAICQTRKIPGHEKQFSDQVLQAAHTQFRGGIGLQQLMLHAACANGYDATPGERIGSNLRRVLRFAFPREDEVLRAGFSTVSLPGIFANIANKELLAGYEADEQLMLWRKIAEVKSVSDFKTVTAYRLLDSSAYEQLAPGGKITHGTLGEESYTRSASTFAKMFKLTRNDIINDDMGAFDDLRKRLGMGAAQKLSDVFWTAFMDNASFFTSGRGNYISGSTTNLGTDGVGLQLGINAFRTLRSPTADGSKRVGGEPKILMVPTELGVNAEKYYVNQNLGGGTSVADANIYANKYEPLIVPWLSDSSFSGYSSTAWYLLRDPAKYAPMVVSFLNGQEQPTVESADADFDELGVQFRGYHDFGCDKSEYLAGIKSKGSN